MFVGKRVLLVDDQPPAVAWLREYLESGGAEVVMEPSFSAALDALNQRRNHFDLVTIDLMMPTTGVPDSMFAARPPLYTQFPGLLLAIAARNSGYGSNKVLLYSVQDTDEIETEAARVGVGYCVKGRPRDLKERIRSLLDR
ncbi:response regulator [Pseudoxanthomonas japonensis]|uniref:Response regulatory domain-containing protein n=1 Tax=Pseudoxanthomonas japonensis TaxID=69284 RepID=A0ABQ6ZGK4_9GAMM|nr:response regulator [Pseudoxanthomonas japonensis]KAF1724812.1 hypothetical protein CSC78_10905 [Pseudoxanthomonas japonensis]